LLCEPEIFVGELVGLFANGREQKQELAWQRIDRLPGLRLAVDAVTRRTVAPSGESEFVALLKEQWPEARLPGYWRIGGVGTGGMATNRLALGKLFQCFFNAALCYGKSGPV
jgi:hypothetical protein